MKIVLATPLYPPDVAWPAPYIKELARRLSPAHSVTVVTYGDMPETVENVRFVAISKRLPRAQRLMLYTLALLKEARIADVIYAENGASVELPLTVASFLSRTPVLLHIGDTRAHERAKKNAALGSIEKAAMQSARKIVADSPLERPEILPFAPYPTNDFAAYEASWQKHLETLEDLLIYAKQ
jgi:hypothetical protein